jgi:hypothetical protein
MFPYEASPSISSSVVTFPVWPDNKEEKEITGKKT